MSLGLWPEAVPFDPDSGTALNDLRRHFDATQLPGAVLLVAARSMRDTAWPRHAAIGLARALADKRGVVLADLDFEHASLHETLGEANGEGVADALLFGASLERVTLRPNGEAFEFVPAGAYAPDPVDLMAHAGWARLLAELSARDALLLAYAPLGAVGLDLLAERIPTVIALAEENDVAPTVALLPETIRVEGVIRPIAAPPPVPPMPPVPPALVDASAAGEPVDAGAVAIAGTGLTTEPGVKLPKDEAREALIADLRARQQTAPPPPPPAAGATGTTGAPGEPRAAPPPRQPAAPPLRRILIGLAVLAAVVIVSVLIGRMLARSGEPPATSTALDGGTSEPAQPAGQILGYSVAIESYDRLPVAVARADSLGLAEPDLTFYIAPIRIDEATYYRVLAGPMLDSISAAAILHDLAARGRKTAASEGDVRSTPLAFEVGRYEFREEAVKRMTELKGQGVPSYVVEVPYTRGAPRYHVYAGAYAGPSEAALMRDVLRRAGVLDTLVLRVGRITP